MRDGDDDKLHVAHGVLDGHRARARLVGQRRQRRWSPRVRHAHLVSELIGEPYRDASGTIYNPLVRQPILVFTANTDEIRTAHARGLDRQVTLAIYTSALFATGHDDANRAAVAAVSRDALDLVGLAFHADKRIADNGWRGEFGAIGANGARCFTSVHWKHYPVKTLFICERRRP